MTSNVLTHQDILRAHFAFKHIFLAIISRDRRGWYNDVHLIFSAWEWC